MKTAEIREKFLKYFEKQGHTRVASSSLVPHNDPTLLYTNAGMNQFKDCFLGAEKRSYVRATSSQRCMRVSGKHNDLENIGVTARHHTFFEMLGNFSFGDYFKKDAIRFAWEFITRELKLPEERLWVTIYKDDSEAEDLWIKEAGVRKERIIRLGEEENFWAMGDTGPCGPCTEIHYYRGDDVSAQSREGFLNSDGLYLEIWNLVFMQYNRQKDGTLEPLPKPAVDTGMGLERIASVMQNTQGNYDIDLFQDIIRKIETLSKLKYDGSSYAVRDLQSDRQYAVDVSMRVIADHSRAVTFIISDGVQPGSEGRAYVLRRILRRAVRHGKSTLGINKPFLSEVCDEVIKVMGEAYPELNERRDHILSVVRAEEEKFRETLETGLTHLNKAVEPLKAGEKLPGQIAFLLHDTYGFPLDLTEDALKPFNLTVDHEGFNKSMEEQKQRSREDRKSKGISYVASNVEEKETEFIGYEILNAEAKLLNVIEASDGSSILIFNRTPFYGESGGQVGDRGIINFNGKTLSVSDTQKTPKGVFLHFSEDASKDELQKFVGQSALLEVDEENRKQIRRHHSATHIVHAGLRKFVGNDVKQAGSLVEGERLRFDYSHIGQVSRTQLQELEEWINEYVRGDYPVTTEVRAIEEAKKMGATALFGEKYGEYVRVVGIGPESLELCGGTHVLRSGEIGGITLFSEGSIASGVRRIECFAGSSTTQNILQLKEERQRIAELLKASPLEISSKVEKLLENISSYERRIKELERELAQSAAKAGAGEARELKNGIKVVWKDLGSSVDSSLVKKMADEYRDSLNSGIAVLTFEDKGKVCLVAAVTGDLADKYPAGKLVKIAAETAGGRGGGKSDFAQAGGLESSRITEARTTLEDFVASN